jgi:hypothetical protein
MQYGVPADLDIADLDDIEEPKQLIHAIVEWVSVEEVEHTETEDGETASRMREIWFPAVMEPCHRGGYHAPAHTFFGPMHVFDSERKAYVYAIKAVKRLHRARTDLEKGLEDLTSEAAAAADTE